MPGGSRLAIVKLNDRLYQLERRITAIAMVIMGTVVFLDVLHRFWTRQSGLFSALFGTSQGGAIASQALGGLIVLAFAYGALRTRGRASGMGTAARALAITVGMYAVMEVFTLVVPNGLVWSQTLGLMLMLWVACMGASMAAHEHRHLALDFGSKLWPKKVLPYAQALGNFITALFCAALGLLAIYSIRQHYGDYVDTEGAGGIFPALPVPKWIAFLGMPLGFFVMSARFFVQTAHSFQGEVEEDDPLLLLGLKDETK